MKNLHGEGQGTSQNLTHGEVPGVSVGRRRLIQAGAAAVPVMATLVSRPAFAALGRTPSAWGSETMSTNVSMRVGSQTNISETWRVSDWTTNASRGSLGRPWIALAPSLGVDLANDKTKDENWFKTVSLSQLFGSLGGLVIPMGSGISSSVQEPVVDWLARQANNFPSVLLTAQLNRFLLQDVQNILTNDQLQQMATGSFKPNAAGQEAWDPMKIVQYLDQNYIVPLSVG